MSERDFTGKVAVITGAASGIGRCTALLLAARGASVCLIDIDGEVENVAGEIRDSGGQAEGYRGDVSRDTEVSAMISAAAGRWGGIDILINNAGILEPSSPIETITDEAWDKVIATNLKGMFYCARYALPYLKSAAQGAAVVNTTSVAGTGAFPLGGSYGPSKGGVIAFTRQLAMEWAKYRIRVNAVAPGLIKTGMTRKIYANEEVTRQRSAFVPLGRIGQPEDIANAIIFFAGPASDYVTGQILTVDGGLMDTPMLHVATHLRPQDAT